MPFRSALPALAASLVVAGSLPAAGEPVEVRFEPPEVEARAVCAPRPPEAELVRRWESWPGETLDGRPQELVAREMRMLRAMDPERWADTIGRASDLMLETYEGYDAFDRLGDRIDLLLALDDRAALEEEGLIPRFIEEARGQGSGALVDAAEYLSAGIGVARDEARALELWTEAAYQGHPTAILKLAELSTEGEAPPDWQIAPDVAVTMAFGAMLGELDPLICDRINRIASRYRLGEVVARDAGLADRWYRLAASLGGDRAAFEVARLHYEAVDFQKDNSVMLAHLEQAADAGYTEAVMMLAGILEAGALADRDTERARDLYGKASDMGSRAALDRLADLALDAGDAEAAIATLEREAGLDDPAPAALVRLGDLILERDGRWAGAERATRLYQSALDIDPTYSAARIRLGRRGLGLAATPQETLDAVAETRRVVRIAGRAAPLDALDQAFRCRSPLAPAMTQAAYWKRMGAYSGNSTVEITPAEAADLDPATTPIRLAELQSQALAGRIRSLSNLFAAVDAGALPAPSRLTDAGGARAVNRALAKRETERGDFDAAKDHLRDAIEAGEPGAEIELFDLLRQAGRLTAEETGLLLELARPLAEKGVGRAILAVVAHDPQVDDRTAWNRYRDAVEANGDFEALIWALPHLQDTQQTDLYLRRASSVMVCQTGDVVDLVEASVALKRMDDAAHWLDVARNIDTGLAWEEVQLADAIRSVEGQTEEVAALYRKAADAGDPVAVFRLLDLREEGGIDLPLPKAKALFVDLLQTADGERLASALAKLDGSDEELRSAVGAEIDRRALYAEAAANGSPRAALELAQIIGADAAGDDARARYAELLTQAARGGSAEAMRLLSEAYAYGIGVAPSRVDSRNWLIRAAEAGDEEALRTARMLDMNTTEATE